MEASSTIAALRQILTSAKTVTWRDRDTVEMVLAQAVSFAPMFDLSEAGVVVSLPAASQASFDRAASRTTTVGPDEKIILKFSLTLEGFIATRTLDELLLLPEAKMREPAAYALFGDKTEGADLVFFAHIHNESLDTAPDDIAGYHRTLRLWSLLTQQCDHVEEGTGALLFFGVRRTEIRPGFERADKSPYSAIQEIDNFVSDEDRRATRLQIFKAELSDYLRDCSPTDAFGYLLRGSDRFARRLREGLAIYLSEHSPQKLANEAKASGLALSEKLEKIISGLETKSLTIPVALILAVKDVQPGAGVSSSNLVIAVSALLFALTMALVHISQKSLLSVLRGTIAATRDDYRRKGLEEQNPVLAVQYQGLVERCRRAEVGSWFMCIASWLPILLWLIFALSDKSTNDTPSIPEPTARAVSSDISHGSIVNKAQQAYDEHMRVSFPPPGFSTVPIVVPTNDEIQTNIR